MRFFEIFIGLRYTRAKRRNHFISFISLISMVGIALGVAALIIVLSVMNGFQQELRSRILGVASHAEISGFDQTLPDWQAIAQRVMTNPKVVAVAPYVQGQGMLAFGPAVQGVVVLGVEPQAQDRVADIAKHMKQGNLNNLKPGGWGIALGSELARALGAGMGDQVTLITPQGQVTPAGMLPRIRQFRVVGIFEVGMYEYDSGMAMVNMQDAATLYRLGDRVTGLRLRLKDLYQAPEVSQEIARLLPNALYITDWTQQHSNFFRAVQIEKNVMFIILLLIVAVAAFNIVSTLVMVVTDKQADIAILRTLGAAPRSIMAIFMVQGSLIGVIGTLIGVASGVAIAINIPVLVPALEHLLGIHFLSKQVYYISELPSKLELRDVVTIGCVSLFLTFFATLYPSYRASRTNPAEALRYE